MAQDTHYHSKTQGRKCGNTKQDQNQPGKLQTAFSHLMSNVFRAPIPFNCVDCNTLLSHGMVPLPVSSFLQQISHDSGISNILGSPRKYRLLLQFHTITSLGLHSAHPGHMCGLGEFCYSRRKVPHTFLLPLKSEV